MRGWNVDAVVTLVALAMLMLWEASGWDLMLVRWYGGTAGFALREAWSTRTLLHDGGRALAAGCLLLLVIDCVHPLVPGPTRRERCYWLLVVITCLTTLPLLKRLSATSCPWDLVDFGGTVPYVPHWLPAVADGGPGHCFPSGHAVAAFAFFGVSLLWRDHRPAMARAIMVAVIAVGALFGWAQMARGAHFASHALWTAWLCWTLSVVARRFAPTAKDREPGTSRARTAGAGGGVR